MESNKNFTDRFDWTLAFILLLLFIVSILAISSAQSSGQYPINFIPRQALWYGVGAVIIAGTMFFEPDQYKRFAWVFYGIGIGVLVVLMLSPSGQGQIAELRNGAKSWFHLPGVGSIQPSEFMKTFFILALARLVTKHHDYYPLKTIKTDFILLGKIAATAALPLALILKQPDLGTSLVFISITVAIIIVSGISWKIILPVFVAGAGIGASLLWMAIYMKDFLINTFNFDKYQIARVYSWLDPYSYSSNEGYNLINAMTAIGSGEISGKGYGGREVYVPENHTDFVFTVIGEEYGFIGASVVVSIFFLLIYHLTKVTLQLKDPFSTYVSAGIIAMVTFHVFQNIGMTIQLLPITGIPLPFISYGGSSLMGNMLALGLVFSMKFHHRTYMFSSDDDE
ncbi:FtsW/RodA/SpoVE family cell cycle protein [Paenisporosarcina cavernae]|uniref:Rod shape-determining protein RodA n=1 Tax=Paenisporosarcina cavernae TaxID=2320858 RepID=A0A385YU20_9BACL|nr:FtsW/RodA/SpoVE family cell cycle protein [Paenisporosarcina cavernae]AYC30375.1 rod shape-determining protein RodA [Paenisporosarcina cavernae]